MHIRNARACDLTSCLPAPFGIVLIEEFPVSMVKGTKVIKVRNGKQVLSKLDKFLITVSA